MLLRTALLRSSSQQRSPASVELDQVWGLAEARAVDQILVRSECLAKTEAFDLTEQADEFWINSMNYHMLEVCLSIWNKDWFQEKMSSTEE